MVEFRNKITLSSQRELLHASPEYNITVLLLFVVQVFEKEMHELAFTFKCPDKRLTSRFVCHMHLRRVIGDHQPIA